MIFKHPLTREHVHQVTLNSNEFLKTELVCFKDLNIDLNDLDEDNINTHPLLYVSMFYRLSNDDTIEVANNS